MEVVDVDGSATIAAALTQTVPEYSQAHGGGSAVATSCEAATPQATPAEVEAFMKEVDSYARAQKPTTPAAPKEPVPVPGKEHFVGQLKARLASRQRRQLGRQTGKQTCKQSVTSSAGQPAAFHVLFFSMYKLLN